MSNLTSHGPNGEVVRLESVSKVYYMGTQSVKAMVDVSISFEEGCFTAIMGPSGSGKSTMLNLLGCLDRPTSGKYFLSGQDVSNMEDNELSAMRLRRLGFIFQSFNLIPQLTVAENIEMPLYYMGWAADESKSRAEQLAAMVGLSERLDHRPAELSGGQQQRVAVARALANDPSVILADEPTGNLDSATGAQIMDLMADLNSQGKTIIMVTHESHIAVYAKRRIHMLDGRIERIEEAA